MMARAVQERTAAGIKHLRRLQSRRVRGAQAKRLSSPARCCLQGVRTRHGISRIHHRCFGSVAASLESRASRLQVSRNSADQEHLDRDLPGKRPLAWKVPLKNAGPSGKMAPGMEGPLEKRRTFRENGPWHGRSPGKTQDLPGKWLLAWKVPLKNAGPSGKMAPSMEGPLEKRRTFRETAGISGKPQVFPREPQEFPREPQEFPGKGRSEGRSEGRDGIIARDGGKVDRRGKGWRQLGRCCQKRHRHGPYRPAGCGYAAVPGPA